MAFKIVGFNPFAARPEEDEEEKKRSELGAQTATVSTPETAPKEVSDLGRYAADYSPMTAFGQTASSPETVFQNPPKNPDPERGGVAAAFADPQQYKELAKGVVPGAIQFTGTTLQGLGAVPASGQANAAKFGRDQQAVWDRIDRGERVGEMEDAAGYQHMDADQRRQLREASTQAQQQFKPTVLAEQPLYKAGQAVKDYAKTVLPAAPGYEGAVGRQLGEGLGSLLAGLPFGAAGRIPATIFFGAGGAGEAGTRAIAYDQAQKAAGKPGLTQEQINTAALFGIAPGTTDLLPVEMLLGRLKVPMALTKPLAKAIGRIGGQAFVEGAQEGGQAFLQNVIAQDYNPQQGLTEGVSGEAGIGAGVGGIAQAAKELAGLALRGFSGRRGAQPQPGAAPQADPFAQPLQPAPAGGGIGVGTNGPIDVEFEDLVPADRRLAPPQTEGPVPQAGMEPPPAAPASPYGQAEGLRPPAPGLAPPDGGFPSATVEPAPVPPIDTDPFAVPQGEMRKGVDVLQFIRANGGLKPSEELRSLDARRYPGLINRNGLSADKMREKMVEAGYLQETGPDQPAVTTPADVYDLLARSISGERIVPQADVEADEAFTADRRRRDDARELQAAEQNFIVPEIKAYDAEMGGNNALWDVYSALDPDTKAYVIDRNRRGEDVVDLLEEVTLRNPMYYAIGAPLRQRRIDKLGYYSKAVEAAGGLKRLSGTGAGYLNDLKKAGVTDNEIEATGLDKLLASKPALTKQEIVDHLEKNQVKLKETTRGFTGHPELKELYEELGRERRNRDALWRRMQMSKRPGETQTALKNPQDWTAADQVVVDHARAERNIDRLERDIRNIVEGDGWGDIRTRDGKVVPRRADAPTQWEEHTLDPSNPTYREDTLSLTPSRRQEEIESRLARLAGADTNSQMQERAQLMAELKQIKEAGYTAGHWPEPNVIAHIRSAIYVDSKGRSTYTLDELQSDWGQAIRDEGAKTEEKLAATQAKLDEVTARVNDTKERAERDLLRNAELLEPQIGETKPFGSDYAISIPTGAANWEGRYRVEGVTETFWNIGSLEGRITHWPRTFDWQGNPGPEMHVISTRDGNLQNAQMRSRESAIEYIKTHTGGLRVEKRLQLAVTRALNEGKTDLARYLNGWIDAIQQNQTDYNLAYAEWKTARAAAPAHPMVNTSEQWIATAMRRVLQQAVDAGVEGIAITPSSIQIKRFSIGAVVNNVDVWPETDDGIGARRVGLHHGARRVANLRVDENGIVTSADHPLGDAKGKSLSAVIGQRGAEAIMRVRGNEQLGIDEIEIGREGMRHFYDKVYPNVLGKLLRKFDPSIKPETVGLRNSAGLDMLQDKEKLDIRSGTSQEPVPFIWFPITQNVRDGLAAEGQPLFAIGGADGKGRDQRAGDRAGRTPSGSLAPLKGAPTVAGATGPDPRVVAAAEQYARENGIELRRQAVFAEVNEELATRIADAFEAMPHAPQDPAVLEAYQDMARQTIEQYKVLEAAGYKFWLYDETTDPYEGNPWNSIRDLRQNQRMAVYATEAGFGSGVTDLNPDDSPMLADSGIMWPYGSPTGPLKRVLVNDLFRAVHDIFGHSIEGAGFRARGEENAWQAHIRLYYGPAVGAVTTETRGQNSWLNFGPYGAANRSASVEDTVFADQKTGLMPEWTWQEGRVGDEVGEGDPKAAAGGDAKATKRHIAAMIRRGRTVTMPHAGAVLEAAGPTAVALPSQAKLGVLARIEPVPGNSLLGRAVFQASDGSSFALVRTLDEITSHRAFFLQKESTTGGFVGLVRLTAPRGGNQRIAGEVGHEAVHALRAFGYLRGADFGALLNHAKKLRILSRDLRDYLRLIEADYSHIEPGLTLLDSYLDLYDSMSNDEMFKALNEEAVAHMLELRVHGALSDEDVAPIREILDRILSGEMAKQGGGVPARTAQAAARAAFAGPKALTANKAKHAKAEEMAARGVPPMDIWQQTGWFKAPDGNWKFEISDDMARLNISNMALREPGTRWRRLGDVFLHPQLYKAYPAIRDMQVAFTDEMVVRDGGHVDNNTTDEKFPRQYFIVGTKGFDGTQELGAPAFERSDIVSVLLHELQHYIQGVEGFAKGSSPAREAEAFEKRYREHTLTPHDLQVLSIPKIKEWGDSALILARAMEADPDNKDIAEAAKLYAGRFLDEVAFTLYERSGGEWEARQVQRRMDLTPMDREQIWPATIDPSVLNFVFGENGPAASRHRDITETPEFKAWFGDSKVQYRYDGGPRAVYHATLKDIEKFSKRKGNPEADMGDGYYFTSEPEDAANNYAHAGGPDVRNRILWLADQFADDPMHEDNWEAVNAGLDSDDPAYIDKDTYFENMARDSLGYTHDGMTLPVYLSIKNPVVVGDPVDVHGHPETTFDFQWNFDEETGEAGEPTGELVEFADAFRKKAFRYDLDSGSVEMLLSDIMNEAGDAGGISASELFKTLKGHDTTLELLDDEGRMMVVEVARQALEWMGYDGIIDQTVFDKWGKGSTKSRFRVGMEGMYPDTTHYIVFKPNQIKSVFNRGTFDPSDDRILYALGGTRAIGAPKEAKARAERMEQKGRAPQEIWQETGWARGPDTKWRWEIDDSGARITNLDKILSKAKAAPGVFKRIMGAKAPKPSDVQKQTNIPLINLLDHPKLYSAYPFLRQMRVDLTYGPNLAAEGALRYSKGKFTQKSGNQINPTIYKPIRVAASTPEEIKTVLLHEIQHYIQNKEGFAKGSDIGRPGDAKFVTTEKEGTALYDPGRDNANHRSHRHWDTTLMKMTLPEIYALRILTEFENLDKYKAARASGDTEAYGSNLDGMIAESEGYLQHFAERLEESMLVDGNDYRNSIGEWEARQVEKRMNLPAGERRVTSPFADVPKELGDTSSQTRDYSKAYNEVMRRAQVFKAIQDKWNERQDIGGGVFVTRPEENYLAYFDSQGEPLVEVKLYSQIAGATVSTGLEAFQNKPFAEQKQIMDRVLKDLRKRNVRPTVEDAGDDTIGFWARYDPRFVAFDNRLYTKEIQELAREKYGPDAEVDIGPNEVTVSTPQMRADAEQARIDFDKNVQQHSKFEDSMFKKYGWDFIGKMTKEEDDRREAFLRKEYELEEAAYRYSDTLDLYPIYEDMDSAQAPAGVDSEMWYQSIAEEQLARMGKLPRPGEEIDFEDLIPTQ